LAGTQKRKYACLYCGNEYTDASYYNSYSKFYSNTGKIPYCKQCIERFYQYYFDKYTNDGCLIPERKAVKRLCMILDVYFREDVLKSALKKVKDSTTDTSLISQYMKIIQLYQYSRNKETYENTITQEEKDGLITISASDVSNISDSRNVDEDTIRFFGAGFNDNDYEFLKREYEDWVARHECKTKAQEEVFKRLCFKQLEILKATQKGEDTKDLDATFQKLLETAKLQPKQNSGDTMSDAQTFGTLIDKWENTRPIPEVEEELKDVDKIGLYIDTFFRGHTCRMLNIKNAFSNLYSYMMKKFTVNKPEYNSEDDDYDSEINFDTIFGDALSDSSD
jgi:hypothetical protein